MGPIEIHPVVDSLGHDSSSFSISSPSIGCGEGELSIHHWTLIFFARQGSRQSSLATPNYLIITSRKLELARGQFPGCRIEGGRPVRNGKGVRKALTLNRGAWLTWTVCRELAHRPQTVLAIVVSLKGSLFPRFPIPLLALSDRGEILLCARDELPSVD